MMIKPDSIRNQKCKCEHSLTECALSLSPSLILCLGLSASHTLPLCTYCLRVCSVEDIEQQKKQDSDSGVGSDNGDKRLSATEVL